MSDCFNSVTGLITKILVCTLIIFLALLSACRPIPVCIVVPHPVKGQRSLLVRPADISKEEYRSFYVLYCQAYGMENEYHDLDCALALYRDAAKYKSQYIKPEDRAAVELKITELEAKITSEN